MKQSLIKIMLFCLLGNIIQGQTPWPVTANTSSLSAGSIITVLDRENGTGGNFALLSDSGLRQVSLNAINRFGLKELQAASLACTFPVKNIQAGVVYHQYGFGDYKSRKFSLMAARQLHHGLHLSLNFDLHMVGIENSFLDSFLGMGIGLSGELVPGTNYGIYISSASSSSATGINARVMGVFIGIRHTFSREIILLGEIEHQALTGPRLKWAIIYTIDHSVNLTIGWSTNPLFVSFGIRHRSTSGLVIDLGAAIHNVLGVSPGISFTRAF